MYVYTIIMDIVICIAKRDFRIIKKTVRYVRMYLQDQEDNIFLIAPSVINKCYSSQWKKKNNVTFICEDELAPGLSFQSVKKCQLNHFKCPLHTGWYLQQFLKMGFALSKYVKEHYLIWDSDTIPLREISFFEGGKYFLAAKTEINQPYFDTMKRLLGFGKLEDFSFIAEHMVIETSIMKELINKIASSDLPGTLWFEKILNATSGVDESAFSEFETYGNYCSKFHPGLYKIRELRTLRECGMLFGRGVSDSELMLLSKMGFDTASFEYYHIPPFPRSLINKYERFLEKIL